jgi:hypothetical protein
MMEKCLVGANRFSNFEGWKNMWQISIVFLILKD